MKKKIKHPYADEYSGSHFGTTESGIPYHVSCSKDFRNNPKAMEALATLIEVARKIPIEELDKLNEAK